MISGNTFEGLLIFDTMGGKNNVIRHNTITGNAPNVYVFNSEIENFHNNVIEDSPGRGIDILSSSHLYFQENVNPPISRGYNRVKDNTLHQIYISHSSRSFLGNSYTYDGRYNSVFHISGPTSNRRYIYNLAVSGPGYTGTPYTVLAHRNFWNAAPSGGMFHGPVDYADHLTYDPTGGSGAPPGGTPLKFIAGGKEYSTVTSVLTAGMVDKITSESTDTQQAGERLALKQRIMELRNLLSGDPVHPHNARRLNELYTLGLLDRNDELRESDNILTVLKLWSERRERMNRDFRNMEHVHLAIETALLLEIRKSIRSGEYGDAGELIEEYAPYISNLDHRMALLKNVIAVYSHNKQYAAALEILGHLESIEPEEDVAAWYSPPNFQPVSLYLTDAMEREGAGASGSFRIADMGSKYIAETIPVEYALSHNYPNPFNPVTTIRFSLPEQSNVRLEVYNTLGQRVRVLIADELYEPGVYSVVWNGVDRYNHQVASGQYIYRIVAGDFVESKRMVLIR